MSEDFRGRRAEPVTGNAAAVCVRLAVELVSHLASIEAEVLCVGHHGEAALQRKALATYSDPDGGFFLTEAMAAAIKRTVAP